MRVKTSNFGLGEYGMVLALGGLCVLFSALTLNRQSGEGLAAERELTQVVLDQFSTE